MKTKGWVKQLVVAVLLAAPLLTLSSCSLLKEGDCDCPGFGKNDKTENSHFHHCRKTE